MCTLTGGRRCCCARHIPAVAAAATTTSSAAAATASHAIPQSAPNIRTERSTRNTNARVALLLLRTTVITICTAITQRQGSGSIRTNLRIGNRSQAPCQHNLTACTPSAGRTIARKSSDTIAARSAAQTWLRPAFVHIDAAIRTGEAAGAYATKPTGTRFTGAAIVARLTVALIDGLRTKRSRPAGRTAAHRRCGGAVVLIGWGNGGSSTSTTAGNCCRRGWIIFADGQTSAAVVALSGQALCDGDRAGFAWDKKRREKQIEVRIMCVNMVYQVHKFRISLFRRRLCQTKSACLVADRQMIFLFNQENQEKR